VELLAAIAIGLNPYAGVFVLASLATFTDHVALSPVMAGVPTTLVGLVAVLAGAALPLDLVLSKFVRFAPGLRRTGQLISPLAAGLGAAAVQQSELPVPLVAAGGAIVAWAIMATVTLVASRYSRDPAWIGLGHIPVLMCTATGAACIIPLGLAEPALGFSVAGFALFMLACSMLTSAQPEQRRASARYARHLRYQPAAGRPATRPATTEAAPAPAAPVITAINPLSETATAARPSTSPLSAYIPLRPARA
jgi:hypothetical protein